MRIGSFQGISVAYYIRNGKQELQPVKRIINLDRELSQTAVKITISDEAKRLNALMNNKPK